MHQIFSIVPHTGLSVFSEYRSQNRDSTSAFPENNAERTRCDRGPMGENVLGNNKQKRMWMKKRLDGGINNNLSGSIGEYTNTHDVVFT